MKVVGCCKVRKELILALEEMDRHCGLKYRIAPFPDGWADEIIGEIDSRYFAGFSTIAGFKIKGKYWGLFAFDPDVKK